MKCLNKTSHKKNHIEQSYLGNLNDDTLNDEVNKSEQEMAKVSQTLSDLSTSTKCTTLKNFFQNVENKKKSLSPDNSVDLISQVAKRKNDYSFYNILPAGMSVNNYPK
jgi:hypothetical protein